MAVLIHGVTSPLGSALLQHRVENGDQVIGFGRSMDKIEMLKTRFPTASLMCMDHSDTRNLEASTMEIVGNSHIESLVVLNGRHELRPFNMVNTKRLKLLLDDNVLYPIEIVRLTLAADKKKRLKSIVMVGSVSSLRGEKGLVGYSTAKSALIGFVKSASKELALKGTRINLISPGFIESPVGNYVLSKVSKSKEDLKEIYPMGIGTADDFVDGVDFLLGKKSAWLTGHNLVLDGGFTA